MFLERSAFLRTLNYLRVSHPHARAYNLLIPMLLTALCGFGLYFMSSINVSKIASLILSVSILLFPFFIASLAAVSTFQGPKGFDATFKMSQPVRLLIEHRGGQKELDVSPRYFLSLLLGYLAALSLLLVFLCSIENLVDFSASPILSAWYLKYVFIVALLFLLFQLLVLTLLVIYYLADYIHREDLR